jgi:phosphatidylserine synthase
MATESGTPLSLLDGIRLALIAATVALGVFGLTGYAADSEEPTPLPTSVVTVVLLASIAVGGLLRSTQAPSPKLRRLHATVTVPYIALAILTLNSLGVWLWPSGLLAALTLVLFRRA